ncbi:MAG: FtsH protease activity modulator HflK [SAR202 cluster bacterium]|nr:FtsH protease activity modulator HflK [SAR202 cluster bacterium]|tara:strand:+ start:25129 stop:26184 length:1056 start_codon:yes stop_codon:yes gene_type:complete
MNRPPEPEIDLNKLLGSIFGGKNNNNKGNKKSNPKRLLFIEIVVLIIAISLWGASGFYQVQPGEQAALQWLGKFTSVQGTGLHWWYPAPLGKKTVVSVEEIRRLEIGFRDDTDVPDESLMITGDENIVDAQLLVQFDISSIEKFLFKTTDPAGIILKSAAESSLRQVVGQRNIDDVLTTEKEAVQSETKILLQRLMDRYDTGIRIREIKLQTVRPPNQVQDAFDDVVRAREDKEKIINLAQAYEADVLPKAKGSATKLIREAEAYKQRRINIATGKADKFLAILTEYKKAPNVTRTRLYLEAIENFLPDINKILVPDNLNLVLVNSEDSSKQLLPLSPPINQTSDDTSGGD